MTIQSAKSSGAADPLKALRAKVQTLRRLVPALADDDEAWRVFLGIHAAERSTRAMGERQLRAVVEALYRAGAPRTHGKPRHQGDPMGKIRALWITLAKAGAVHDGSEAAMAAFIRRQTGQDFGALNARAGRSVIEALKAWSARHAAAEGL